MSNSPPRYKQSTLCGSEVWCTVAVVVGVEEVVVSGPCSLPPHYGQAMASFLPNFLIKELFLQSVTLRRGEKVARPFTTTLTL